MATPTVAQITAVRTTSVPLVALIQQYQQASRIPVQMTVADQKAVLTAAKTALDALITQIG